MREIKKRYSKEELIALLQGWAKKYNTIPNKRRVNSDTTMPSEMAFRCHFGSWSEALKAAGFTPTKFIPKGARKGKRNKSRKKVISHNYVHVFEPHHPMAMKNGYVREHRMIAYDAGLLKNKQDDVHHVNEQKADNKNENLKVLPKGDHARLHHKGKRKLKDTDPKCVMCDERTTSRYGLCKKHYKLQWQRVRQGLILNIHEHPHLITPSNSK